MEESLLRLVKLRQFWKKCRWDSLTLASLWQFLKNRHWDSLVNDDFSKTVVGLLCLGLNNFCEILHLSLKALSSSPMPLARLASPSPPCSSVSPRWHCHLLCLLLHPLSPLPTLVRHRSHHILGTLFCVVSIVFCLLYRILCPILHQPTGSFIFSFALYAKSTYDWFALELTIKELVHLDMQRYWISISFFSVLIVSFHNILN